MKEGYYTATHSDLFVRVHKVYHISERTGKIKMRVSIFYKSNHNLCEWLTPRGPKNMNFIYDGVKHWESYNPHGDKDEEK